MRFIRCSAVQRLIPSKIKVCFCIICVVYFVSWITFVLCSVIQVRLYGFFFFACFLKQLLCVFKIVGKTHVFYFDVTFILNSRWTFEFHRSSSGRTSAQTHTTVKNAMCVCYSFLFRVCARWA